MLTQFSCVIITCWTIELPAAAISAAVPIVDTTRLARAGWRLLVFTLPSQELWTE